VNFRSWEEFIKDFLGNWIDLERILISTGLWVKFPNKDCGLIFSNPGTYIQKTTLFRVLDLFSNTCRGGIGPRSRAWNKQRRLTEIELPTLQIEQVLYP
jgi:hypothetical protein